MGFQENLLPCLLGFGKERRLEIGGKIVGFLAFRIVSFLF
jgi:hypothetical protein